MRKAVNVAVLEAIVIVCLWLGFCVVTGAPYPSWWDLGFFTVGWFVVTVIRHAVYRRRRS